MLAPSNTTRLQNYAALWVNKALSLLLSFSPHRQHAAKSGGRTSCSRAHAPLVAPVQTPGSHPQPSCVSPQARCLQPLCCPQGPGLCLPGQALPHCHCHQQRLCLQGGVLRAESLAAAAAAVAGPGDTGLLLLPRVQWARSRAFAEHDWPAAAGSKHNHKHRQHSRLPHQPVSIQGDGHWPAPRMGYRDTVTAAAPKHACACCSPGHGRPARPRPAAAAAMHSQSA